MRVIFKPEIHGYSTCHIHKIHLIIVTVDSLFIQRYIMLWISIEHFANGIYNIVYTIYIYIYIYIYFTLYGLKCSPSGKFAWLWLRVSLFSIVAIW